MDPDLEDELPVWRAVMEGKALSDVKKWDLDEIRKFNSLLNWKADLEKAQRAFSQSKVKGDR